MDWKEQAIREVFENRVPTILLGSGVSIATGSHLGLKYNFPGMRDLAKHLYQNVDTEGFTDTDAFAWEAFKHGYESLGNDAGKFNLERFLADHPLAPDSLLLLEIVRKTAEAFTAPHRALREAIEHNPSVTFPLRSILDKLLRSTPANHPWLSIITPNYDLVVEYTSDLIGAPCMTGFSGRIIRKWMPQIGFTQPMVRYDGRLKYAKCLKLIKPHGSFAWFRSETDKQIVVECFSASELHGKWHRCIVVPGPSKYSETLKDVKREHMHWMDHALKEAQSLLIVGYGFNDPHLEEQLKQSLNRGTPAIYVTRELSEEARANFVVPYNQVTCITSDDAEGTLVQAGPITTKQAPSDMWQLQGFVKEFIL